MIAVRTMSHHPIPPPHRSTAMYPATIHPVKHEPEQDYYTAPVAPSTSGGALPDIHVADPSRHHYTNAPVAAPSEANSGWRWHNYPSSGSGSGPSHPYPDMPGSYEHGPGPYDGHRRSPGSPKHAHTPGIGWHHPVETSPPSTLQPVDYFALPVVDPVARDPRSFGSGPSTSMEPNHLNLSLHGPPPASPAHTHLSDA